ncbi:MAG: sulfotransferase family 2 domain-containing protein [Saprospiraceae bacterium]|nr:sulfotransferase family 2 domain-containing protein [Saprospiraceae bacterium]
MKLNSILFIHIPRTGGTHLEKLLGFKGHDSPPRCGSAGYGANYEEIMGWDQRTGKMLQHLSYRELVELNFICPDNDLFKLAIIRNPYQRAVSLYKYFGGSFKWGDYLSFLQHLQGNLAEEYFYRSQYEYVFYLGTNQMNEIIRFENYVKDLARIKESKKLNIEVKFDTSRQSKQEQDYFNLYYHNNPAAIEAVNKIYEKDFEHFGYKKLETIKTVFSPIQITTTLPASIKKKSGKSGLNK